MSRPCAQLILAMLASQTLAVTIQPTLEAIQSSSSNSSDGDGDSSSSGIGATYPTDAGWAISRGTAILASTMSVKSIAAGEILAVAIRVTLEASQSVSYDGGSSSLGSGITDWNDALTSSSSSMQTVAESSASSSWAPAIGTTDEASPRDAPVASNEGLSSVTTAGDWPALAGNGSSRVIEVVTTASATGAAVNSTTVAAVSPPNVRWDSLIVLFVILASLLAGAAIIGTLFLIIKCSANRIGRFGKHRWNADSAGNSCAPPATAAGAMSLAAVQTSYVSHQSNKQSLDGCCWDGSRASDRPDVPRDVPRDVPSDVPPSYRELSASLDSEACLDDPPAATSDFGLPMTTFFPIAARSSCEGTASLPYGGIGFLNLSFSASKDGIARTAL